MMTRNYRFTAAALLVAGAVACSQPNETKVVETKVKAAQSERAPAPLPDGLTNCSTLAYSEPVLGESVTKTCGIALSGPGQGSSFKVELVSGKVTEPPMPGDDAAVRVTKMVGANAGQVIEETGVRFLTPPESKDVNGDGTSDLLITRSVGNVHPSYGVWIGSSAGAPFVRAGEITGEFGPLTPDGFMPVFDRSEPWSIGVSFYKYAEQKLGLIGSVSVTATDPGGDGPVKDRKCELDNISGLAAAGLSTEQAKAKFCADPFAADAFKP